MIPALLSFIGIVIAGVLSLIIYRAGRAALRRKFREAAAKDSKEFGTKGTIGE
jgi:hypothetical protein